jgi:hypothetical protein
MILELIVTRSRSTEALSVEMLGLRASQAVIPPPITMMAAMMARKRELLVLGLAAGATEVGGVWAGPPWGLVLSINFLPCCV